MLNEVHWTAMAPFLRPVDVPRLLALSLPGSFDRCKNTVYCEMLTTCLATYADPHVSVKDFFDELTRVGFLPRVRWSHLPNSDTFGFIRDNKWCEWRDVANVSLMRQHWQSMSMHSRFLDLCRCVVALLPGDKRVCVRCRWVLPYSEMFADDVCNYCFDVNES
jgi:hypothetical protein